MLEKAFGVPKSLFKIQSEIAHIKQNLGESILSYVAKTVDLFSKVVEIAESQFSASIVALKVREYDLEAASCFCMDLRGELEFRV